MTSDPKFIHLRLHTEYSLLEGAIRLKKLPDMATAMGMPAIAVTDTNNMFCALEFSEVAAKADVQPIIGCQVDVAFEASAPGEKAKMPAPVVLLAQNESGYGNLMALNSCLYLDSDGQLPQVQIAQLAKNSSGLICLTGGPSGPIGLLLQNGQATKAQVLMTRLAEIFEDRLYVELQRHTRTDGTAPNAERLTERGSIAMAYKMN